MNTERAVSPNRTKFQTALTLALSNKHVECEVMNGPKDLQATDS